VFIELLYSFLRMLIAYLFSLIVAYLIGYTLTRKKLLEKFLMPLIDILQSVPILTFFPIALYIIIHFFSQPLGPEIAVIFLIFTSMVWNLIFAVYESFLSFPKYFKDLIKQYKINKLGRLFRF